MDHKLTLNLTSRQLADRLRLPVLGPDLPIVQITPFSSVIAGALCFNNGSVVTTLSVAATVIAGEPNEPGSGSLILSKNPRLDFARALEWIEVLNGFVRPTCEPQIDPSVQIGKGCVLAPGVRVGANTVIQHNVVIGEGVVIGERCVIKSGAVIGEDGFGFERDEVGIPIRLCHLGTVIIGNDVEIGSLTTVCRGTLGNTIIEDFAKIDDHVHIAHNVWVRRAAMVIACAEVSGGVEIGEQAWIGPNASILQQVKIGKGALVGIGANVLRGVIAEVTVVGNPAKPLHR